MFDGVTPLSKRCCLRRPSIRALGEVFVDEVQHFSIGPCHPHLILLLDIDFVVCAFVWPIATEISGMATPLS